MTSELLLYCKASFLAFARSFPSLRGQFCPESHGQHLHILRFQVEEQIEIGAHNTIF